MRDHLVDCGFDYLCTDSVDAAIGWLKAAASCAAAGLRCSKTHRVPFQMRCRRLREPNARAKQAYSVSICLIASQRKNRTFLLSSERNSIPLSPPRISRAETKFLSTPIISDAL